MIKLTNPGLGVDWLGELQGNHCCLPIATSKQRKVSMASFYILHRELDFDMLASYRKCATIVYISTPLAVTLNGVRSGPHVLFRQIRTSDARTVKIIPFRLSCFTNFARPVSSSGT